MELRANALRPFRATLCVGIEMKGLKFLVLFFIFSFSPMLWAERGGGIVNIVVTDFSYYYAGERSETMKVFEESIKEDIEAKFLVSACACADAKIFAGVIDLLRDLGAKNIAVESLGFDSDLCLECK
jgi:hypothetical protein